MIKLIRPSTEKEWSDYYRLRYEVLRKPWGQPLGSEKDDQENESIHFFALVDNEPAGVCRLQYNSSTEAQIRFMGIDEKFRGKKIGNLLMNEAENTARNDGRTNMVLQARENAVGFYTANGYAIIEKTFLLWDTIQHYKMVKSL